MKKNITIIVLALIASLATAQTDQKQTTQTFSMEDLEGLIRPNYRTGHRERHL